MIYGFLYLMTVIFVNVFFESLPFVQTPLGTVPLMAFFVGFIFVLRDYTQRFVGSNVLWLMVVGCVISGVLAPAHVVLASVAAFAVSEFVDYLVFTITKKPFHQRVLYSSLVSVPLDSIVFLVIIGVPNPGAMLAMTISKFAASALVWYIYRYKGWTNVSVQGSSIH